jgi:hypothetical protein
VLGMVVFLLFTNLVRWLHYSAKVPIVPAIAFSVGVYIAAYEARHSLAIMIPLSIAQMRGADALNA